MGGCLEAKSKGVSGGASDLDEAAGLGLSFGRAISDHDFNILHQIGLLRRASGWAIDVVGVCSSGPGRSARHLEGGRALIIEISNAVNYKQGGGATMERHMPMASDALHLLRDESCIAVGGWSC